MYQNNSAPQYDRITQMLQQRAVAQAPPSQQDLHSMLLAHLFEPGGYAKAADAAGQNYQTNSLTTQMDLLRVFEAKKAAGDSQTKALDDKISLFTGNDPEGKALFLNGLHNDPEEIDPGNSYQVMTKLAGIAKRSGYKSPELAMQKQKDQLDIDLKKAQINSTNALADHRTNNGLVPKPIPSSALKLQQEGLDAIGTASSIDADLGNIVKSIDLGDLKLGLGTNLVSEGRNMIGKSSENSRNYATFNASLQKLRNDSLRLNKGVQTEGDAVRAWDEILKNINDPDLVKQRLQEVQQINRRAAELHKLNVDQIRGNYGYEPLDMSGYKQGPAILNTSGNDGWSIKVK